MRTLNVPTVCRELAAEPAAHVLHLHADVRRRYFQVAAHLRADGGYGLRRRPVVDLVALPLNHSSVRFETAVRDNRDAICSFGGDLGFFKARLGIAGDGLA